MDDCTVHLKQYSKLYMMVDIGYVVDKY